MTKQFSSKRSRQESVSLPGRGWRTIPPRPIGPVVTLDLVSSFPTPKPPPPPPPVVPTRHQPSWEERFEELTAFKKQFGHCRVSTICKEHASLGCWVRTQRGKQRRGELSEEHFAQLDSLGFCWKRPPRTMSEKQKARLRRAMRPELERLHQQWWDEAYSQLEQFYRKHGHSRVRRSAKYSNLYRWMTRQRKARLQGRLSRTRIRQLNALGFNWKQRRGRPRKDEK